MFIHRILSLLRQCKINKASCTDFNTIIRGTEGLPYVWLCVKNLFQPSE